MGKVAKKTTKKSRGSIRAKINIPGINVDICTTDSLNALREVRKIIDTIKSTHLSSGEEEFEELNMDASHKNIWWSISEEARSNTAFMEFIQLASKTEEQVLYKRVAIPNKSVIDMVEKKSYATVEVNAVRKAVQQTLQEVQPHHVKFVAAHILSNVSEQEKNMICDIVGEQTQKVDVQKAFTDKNMLGKTVVEILLFGSHTD